jgi:O-antigen ligase
MGRVGERHRAQLVFSTVVLLVILAAFVNAEGLASRVSDTLGSGSTGRLEIWRNTVPIVRDFPIVGIGGGTFADVMLLYQRTERGVLFNHAHNEYLQLLTEGGVLLFALVVIGCSAAIHVARTQLRHDVGPERWMRVGACAAVIGVATQSVWETGLRAPANLLLAAMVAGLALSDPRARRRRSSQ